MRSNLKREKENKLGVFRNSYNFCNTTIEESHLKKTDL